MTEAKQLSHLEVVNDAFPVQEIVRDDEEIPKPTGIVTSVIED